MRGLSIALVLAASITAVTFVFDPFGGLARLLAAPALFAFAFTIFCVHLVQQAKHEVEDRKTAETALRESEERYRELFENANDMMYTHDLEGCLTSINKAGERLTGYTRDQAMNMNISTLLDAEYQQQVGISSAHGFRLHQPATIESGIITRQGQLVPIEVSMRPILEDGKPIGVHGIVRDIIKRRGLERQLVELASHDPLTGLFNRRRFEEELQHQLARARRGGTPGALLFLDLDYFKEVNDSLGHWAGDTLLAGVASLLRERLRKTDVIARLGGDEFTIVLPDTGPGQARNIADEILVWLRNRDFPVAGQTLSVTASVGITLIPSDGIVTAQELLSQADLAMYQAKEKGRNCVMMYGAEMDWQAQIRLRLRWRRRLLEAFEANLFVLHAQPILDLRSNKLSQYELLLRLTGQGEGTQEATALVYNAQRFGFVQAIDRWVVARAIQLIAEHGQQGPRLILEANISGRAFEDKELLPLIRKELAATSADPRCLVLEVTESAAIANIQQAQRFVADLKAIGCRFALDDFGVGFSSFSQLKHIDVDYLKIDGSFVQDLVGNNVDRQLVKTIVGVARALGQETIAEFVGDEETLRLLRQLGVDYAQGYYVGEPREASEVLSEAGTMKRHVA